MTDFVLKLIDLVKERPALWDKDNEYYHNRTYVDSEWTEIGIILGKPKSVPTLKWRYIRDTYKRELKRIIVIDGQNTYYYTGKWQYFDKMSFMKKVFLDDKIKKMTELQRKHTNLKYILKSDYLEQVSKLNKSKEEMIILRKTETQGSNSDSSVKELAIIKTEVEEETSMPVEAIKDEYNDSADESEIKQITANATRDTNIREEKPCLLQLMTDKDDYSRKRKESLSDSDMETEYKKAKKAAEMSDDLEKFSDLNEDVHFVLSLVPYMKKLNPSRKLLVRNEIQDLLWKELFNECQNDDQEPPFDKHT